MEQKYRELDPKTDFKVGSIFETNYYSIDIDSWEMVHLIDQETADYWVDTYLNDAYPSEFRVRC